MAVLQGIAKHKAVLRKIPCSKTIVLSWENSSTTVVVLATQHGTKKSITHYVFQYKTLCLPYLLANFLPSLM